MGLKRKEEDVKDVKDEEVEKVKEDVKVEEDVKDEENEEDVEDGKGRSGGFVMEWLWGRMAIERGKKKECRLNRISLFKGCFT